MNRQKEEKQAPASAEVGKTLSGIDPRQLVELAFAHGATAPRILWEDETLVGVIKPAGMLSTPDEKGRTPDLVTWLSAACRAPVYPVHRLDEPVAGVMVYAKSAQSAAGLTEAMARGEWEKEYLALCHGDAAEVLGEPVGTPAGVPAGTLSDLLFRDAAKNKSYVVKRMRQGVREARLSYRVLTVFSDKDFSENATPLNPSAKPSCWSLLAVRLHTGRTHQIRVQFASRGLPLVGDGRYGGGKRPPAGWSAGWQGHKLALFSYRLAFPHPVTKEKIVLQAFTGAENGHIV